MSLKVDQKLAQYEIVEPIGAGGMGEVHRARDTKLGRDVAIKVLPEEFSRDKERLDRFEREVKLLAQLNYSNVATFYGFEDGYLVMESRNGVRQRDRLSGEQLMEVERLVCHGVAFASTRPRCRSLPR